MISIFTIFSELLILFFIVLIGFLAKKFGLFKLQADYVLTQIILFITLPLLIIYSLDYKISLYIFQDFLWLILLSVIILCVVIVIASLLAKHSKLADSRKGVYEGLLIFGNQGFIGFVLAYLFFKEQGIAYATIFNIFYIILIWTYGIYVVAKHKVSLPLRKFLLNPGVIATIIGLLLLTTPLTLPHTLSVTFEIVGLATIPLSMLFIGSILGNVKGHDLFCYLKHYHLWLVALFRLLLFPLFLLPFLFLPISYEVIMIAVLLTATPSAPTIALYAKKYHCDARFASVGVFLTTVLACFTIPFLYWLFMLLCL
jgi:malate permease and related proteins